MVVAGRTAHRAAGHKDAAQEGTAAAALAQENVAGCFFRLARRQDAQLLQRCRHGRIRQDFNLVTVVLFEPPGPRDDDLCAYFVVVFQHLQHPPGERRVFRRKMDAHVHAAQDDGPAHAEDAQQFRFFTAGLQPFDAGQLIFDI